VKSFEYARATDVGSALMEVGQVPNSKFLGGGTNLVDLMRYEVESPDRLVDVGHIPLNKIELLEGGAVRIGALVRNSDLAAHPDIVRNFPVLSQALLNGASPQLRNMATTGGNLLQRTRCYYFNDTAFPCNKREPGSGCPAIVGYNRIHAILGQSDVCIAVHPSDMAVALAALDATIHVEGKNGKRDIPIADFHRLPGDTPQVETSLEPGELVVSVTLPHSGVAKNSHYVKVKDRASYAFALVSVAAALEIHEGKVTDARIALGGVAHKPWRAKEAERSLIGKSVGKDSLKLAADLALSGAKGYEHNQFKIELAKRTIVRAFMDIVEGKGNRVPGENA
jgi:xanthine dehydrogenase YagS FAD-binding subunit